MSVGVRYSSLGRVTRRRAMKAAVRFGADQRDRAPISHPARGFRAADPSQRGADDYKVVCHLSIARERAATGHTATLDAASACNDGGSFSPS